jgi:hypothetical protein
MLMIWLLWLVVVVGGFYMGLGYAWGAYRQGYPISMALNALLYLGCACYGLPRLLKLVFKR